MPFFTVDMFKPPVRFAAGAKSPITEAAQVLTKQASVTPLDQKFDIFLSHSYKDAVR